ncbi:hypothetical protein [Microbulbifer hainanensis]|uniref:hypothetical protein n=1 Tax=Microbulbifer hainanensis TaxID=2735675 RepID=UPI0018684D8A|nr:hypothetical protein [Microbulbifer hainanensis]
MRFPSVTTALIVIALGMLSGCGYLPSELSTPGSDADSGGPHARIIAIQHTASCDTPARGFRTITFDDLYATTGDPDKPFRKVASAPAQYDINAYVWGTDNCSRRGQCNGGDHFWLIERGPGSDFSTWVVTPQFPRITIQSNCRDQLKVGKRYRFSFSRGALIGISR